MTQTPDRSFSANADLQESLRQGTFSHWQPILAASRIVVSHHADERSPGGPCPRSARSHVLPSVYRERAAVGDLVSLRDSPMPTPGNQHLRRIVSITPSRRASDLVDITLGEALPRREWPDAMRSATIPTAISVAHDGPTITVTGEAGRKVRSFEVEPINAGVWTGYVGSLVRKAAEDGRRDAGSDAVRSFGIRNASENGRRTWELVDSSGKVYAKDNRSLLHRRPTEKMESMLVVAQAAYRDGLEEGLRDLPRFVQETDEAPVAMRAGM
jgi:hypothetical protein